MNREFSQVTKELTHTSGMTVKMLFSMLGGYKNKQVINKTVGESLYLSEKTISADVMTKAHRLAKKQGATLNDLFLTAFSCIIAIKLIFRAPSICGNTHRKLRE